MADEKVKLTDNHNHTQEFDAGHADRLLAYPNTQWRKADGGSDESEKGPAASRRGHSAASAAAAETPAS